MAEYRQAPGPAPMHGAGLPSLPHARWRVLFNPAGFAELAEPAAHRRRKDASYPARERQRESLLRMADDVVGQRPLERAVE